MRNTCHIAIGGAILKSLRRAMLLFVFDWPKSFSVKLAVESATSLTGTAGSRRTETVIELSARRTRLPAAPHTKLATLRVYCIISDMKDEFEVAEPSPAPNPAKNLWRSVGSLMSAHVIGAASLKGGHVRQGKRCRGLMRAVTERVHGPG